MIAGDSIVKGQKGWLMSREQMVKVHSFSGAKTDDMDFFLKPLLNREPDHLILRAHRYLRSERTKSRGNCKKD